MAYDSHQQQEVGGSISQTAEENPRNMLEGQSEEIRRRTGQEILETIIRIRRLRWFRHVQRH